MFKNYIKVALRNLFKNRLFSFINIGGLAIGMAVAIVISLWICDEVTFNQYHDNYDRIAQVMQSRKFSEGIGVENSQPKNLAPVLREDYGDHFEYVVLSSWHDDRTLARNEKRLKTTGMFMEADAPKMLSLKMKAGDMNALESPNTILISTSTATAFFGAENPINQSIQIGNDDLVNIAGVYEDIPNNSEFANLDFLAPWEIYEKELPDWIGWGNNWFQVFVQLKEQSDISQVSQLIKDVKLKNMGERAAEFNPQLFLHPMSKWHLYSEFKNGVNTGGLIKYVWLFAIIGLIVLLLACINFMNLSTARSEKRAKEVGIRKAVGSSRNQLIGQFFSESVVLSLFAFGLSILLVIVMLPFFNEVADKEMRILWSNPVFWLLGIGFSIFTGLLAGTYPALYLSSFKAVRALKGTFKAGKLAGVPRKVLVVLQFTVSVALIISTIVIFNQIQYAKDRAIGYDQKRLIDVPIKSEKINQHFDAIRNDLIQENVVEEMALSQSSLTQVWNTNSGFNWEGKPAGFQEQFWSMRISYGFGQTVDWEITRGRDFSKELTTDNTAFIINEAAVDYLGFEDPIGKILDWGNNGKHEIIGVVQNIITDSPYTPTKQMFFMLDPDRTYNTVIKISPNANTKQALATIESIYQKYDPINPFEYEFVDQSYAEKFGEEERIGKLAGFFALLAIFISCLGLFAMISFVAEQRTKEIGIRKVLGASIANIVGLLSKEFLALVVIALIIATPLAWYMMNQWLEDFTYRVDIQWWMFALASFGAILIAFLTVSFQSVKAALANPVESLRNE